MQKALVSAIAFLMLAPPALASPLDPTLRAFLRLHERGLDPATRVSVAAADLRGTGEKDLLVWLQGPDTCGSGGCDLLVLAPTFRSYRLVSTISITRPPIMVLPTSTHGWRDLAVLVSGGGLQPGYEAKVPFRRRGYATDPTVPPASRLRGKTGAVLLSGDEPGEPLGS